MDKDKKLSLWDKLYGGLGKTLTSVGTKYNLPELTPGGAGIKMQQAAAANMPVEDRIAHMYQNTGYVAPADTPTAINLGYDINSTKGGANTSGINSGGILTNDAYQNYNTSTRNQLGLTSDGVDTTDKKDTSGTATPKGDLSLEDLIEDLERQKLEKQREDQLSMIRANLASGRQYYNDAFSGLERKRGEFQQRHDDDLDDLMTTYGGDIADLQATAEGSDARLANAALAQGISGSGLDELLRRNEVSKQRQLGTARETRQSNERANTAALNENFNWALGQEEAINRAKDDLESQARLAENTTWSNFQNTLGDLITQSLANKQALQASGLGVGNYQNLAADLLGSGIDTGALTNAFNSTMGATQNNSQSINPQYANMSLLDQEKRQKGLIV